MQASVYTITHRATQREYVGITSRDPETRWKEHEYDARAGRTSMHIHRALKKYGSEAFDFAVVAKVPTLEEAKIVEMLWCATEKPEFNLTSGGQGSHGRVKSEAERKAIGDGRRGKPCTPETRAKISASVSAALIGNRHAKGFKHSAQTRAKVSAGNSGRKHSQETRAQMSVSMQGNTNGRGNKGRVCSPETRAKISAARRAAEAKKVTAP